MKQTNSSIIIGAGKSKRLDAMRNMNVQGENSYIHKRASIKQLSEGGLSESTKGALIEARTEVEQRMTFILNAFPPGKANTYFRIKYKVKAEQIKTLSLANVFSLLEIDDSKIKGFSLVEHLNFNGTAVDA